MYIGIVLVVYIFFCLYENYKYIVYDLILKFIFEDLYIIIFLLNDFFVLFFLKMFGIIICISNYV